MEALEPLVAQIELPPHFDGKDLRTLDLRNKQGIEVFLIRQGVIPTKVGIQEFQYVRKNPVSQATH